MLISISFEVNAILLYSLVFVTIFLTCYACFDVNYFVTIFLITLWCKVRRKRVKIEETTEYYGVCTTNDLDVYLRHMNNARYIRELDFARYHFYKRAGVYDLLVEAEGVALQSTTHIRYRRSIALLTPYKVTSKIIYWDEKNIYLEHQFVTLSDGFVAAVVLCKQTILGVNVLEMLNKLLEKKDESYRPKAPPELEDLIHLNKKSSARLRTTNNIYIKPETCVHKDF